LNSLYLFTKGRKRREEKGGQGGKNKKECWYKGKQVKGER
jgi:hypothetical protein